MPRLPEDEKVLIHIIRQDYAKALAAFQADPCEFNREALEEASARRDRAARSLDDEDWPVKFISAIMKMSKSAVRKAIDAGAE
jgi:hypothetical protein